MDAVKTDDGYVMVSGWPDIWLTKIDGHGNIIWQKRISSGHWEVPKSIVRADDGYAIVGDIGLDKTDVFLIKTDENGNILWKKTYGDKNRNEFGREVIKATKGFLLVGTKMKGPGDGIPWVIKTDENGTEIWNKTYIGEGWGDDAVKIEKGYFITAYEGWNVILIKIDENGTEIWNKTYSRGAFEGSARIIKIEDGYLIGGWGDPGSYFLKVDNEGNKIWYCNYLGRDPTFLDIAEADDGYIGAGYTYTKTVGSSDIWLLKVNKSRGDKVIWMKNFGGRGGDGAGKIFVENNSYILLGVEETEKDVFKGVIIKCGDYKPPEINITRPRPNYLYVFDREIMPYGYTMAIGKITVVVNVTNPSGAEINRVEFYIQKNKYPYEPSKVVYSPPYEWTVDIPVVGWIELTAGLYYGGCDGVVAASMEMRILKLM
ncbi:MAG: hypothetical protein J7K61_05815 [Thermoplasmata archaeon]|nr:hypothetical protein [Thermoplasmata archaeon]